MTISSRRYFQYCLLLPLVVFAAHDYVTLDLTRGGDVSHLTGILIRMKDYIPYAVFIGSMWLLLNRLPSKSQLVLILLAPPLYGLYFYTTLFWWLDENHLMKLHLADFARVGMVAMAHGLFYVAGIAMLIGYAFVVPVVLIYFAMRNAMIPNHTIVPTR
jgi:uncharacterized membrane protein (GlpM family)